MSLEGEALLIGSWKNIQEMEECLTLEELQLAVEASREREHRQFKFQASLKGIDIDSDGSEEKEDPVEAAKRRANARLSGKSDEEIDSEVELASFADFGIEIETD